MKIFMTRKRCVIATVKLPSDKFAPTSDSSSGPSTSAVAADMSEPKKIILNSSEELFAELRDRNFHAVGPILSKKAKLISAEFDVSSLVPRSFWNIF